MNNLREFWCGFVLAMGVCIMATAIMLADSAKSKIDAAVQTGVLVWGGKAYVVEEMGGRE